MMALSMLGLIVGHDKWILYISIALVGYGNSNVFSLIFAQALKSVPTKRMRLAD